LARARGDTAALVDYLASLVSAGAAPEVYKELAEVYRKTHDGSLDGLDTLLDARFRAFARPLHVTPYARPNTATRRLVLAELFTGAAEFTVTIIVLPTAKPGPGSVGLQARYQMCNDRICLPPTTDTIAVPLQVAAAR
jgi:hypothetical protein